MFFSNCRRFFALVVTLSFGSSEAKVWVTHGFSPKDIMPQLLAGTGPHWYEEGGDFYEALKKTAAANGHTIASFSWDQPRCGYYDEEHLAGGIKLAAEIINFCNTYTFDPAYPNDAEIIVVAHSFGGKVSYHTSHILESFFEQEKKAQLTAKPTSEKIGLMASIRNAFKNAFPRYQQQPRIMPKPVISKLFTLGTPHRLPEKPASAETVKKVYNCYSYDDQVAHPRFGGHPFLTAAMQQQHPYAYDIELLGKTADIKHGFGHSEIHNEHVARELFSIGKHVDDNVEFMKKAGHNHANYCVVVPK
jgi:hypothetical protein